MKSIYTFVMSGGRFQSMSFPVESTAETDVHFALNIAAIYYSHSQSDMNNKFGYSTTMCSVLLGDTLTHDCYGNRASTFPGRHKLTCIKH